MNQSSGISVLALHGFTGRGTDFAPLAAASEHDWHCPDLPGHGPEPQLDCSPVATTHFIQEQLTTPSNILLGYSMGARAALLHATMYPEVWDAVILISPNPGIQNDTDREARARSDQQLAEKIAADGIDAFIDFWQSTPLIRSQKNAPQDLYESMLSNRREHTVEGLSQSLLQFGQGVCPNLWPELSKLTMPVHLITGELDTKYTAIAKAMAAGSNTFRHHEMSELSHAPHLEAPDKVAELLRHIC